MSIQKTDEIFTYFIEYAGPEGIVKSYASSVKEWSRKFQAERTLSPHMILFFLTILGFRILPSSMEEDEITQYYRRQVAILDDFLTKKYLLSRKKRYAIYKKLRTVYMKRTHTALVAGLILRQGQECSGNLGVVPKTNLSEGLQKFFTSMHLEMSKGKIEYQKFLN